MHTYVQHKWETAQFNFLLHQRKLSFFESHWSCCLQILQNLHKVKFVQFSNDLIITTLELCSAMVNKTTKQQKLKAATEPWT